MRTRKLGRRVQTWRVACLALTLAACGSESDEKPAAPFSQIKLTTFAQADREHALRARITGPHQRIGEDSIPIVFDNAVYVSHEAR